MYVPRSCGGNAGKRTIKLVLSRLFGQDQSNFTALFAAAPAASESGLQHAPSNHEEGRAMHGRGPPLARLDPVDKAARS